MERANLLDDYWSWFRVRWIPMPATSPKPFVFILMPFEAAFDDAYQLGIRAACKEAGAYCERVESKSSRRAFSSESTTRTPRPTSSLRL